MTVKNTYIKDGYVCKYTKYKHICLRCGKHFESNKTHQKYCSKSCSCSATKNNSLGENEIFNKGKLNEFSAYVLGLIWSDGSISNNRIDLTLKDYDMMKYLHDKITPNKKLYKNNNSYSIRSSNENDINYLKFIGMSNTKSYDAVLPILEKSLMPHLIRGWFDGDGCVYKSTTINKKYNYQKTYLRVSFTSGSEIFVNQLKDFLNGVGINCRINKDCRHNVKRNHDTYYLQINKMNDVKKFSNYIYNNATIYLDRKYNKFKDIV